MKDYCVPDIKLSAGTHHSIILNEIHTWKLHLIRYKFKVKLMSYYI